MSLQTVDSLSKFVWERLNTVVYLMKKFLKNMKTFTSGLSIVEQMNMVIRFHPSGAPLYQDVCYCN